MHTFLGIMINLDTSIYFFAPLHFDCILTVLGEVGFMSSRRNGRPDCARTALNRKSAVEFTHYVEKGIILLEKGCVSVLGESLAGWNA